MEKAHSEGVRENEHLSFSDLLKIIWDGKWIIVPVTFVFAVASVFIALSLPNIYEAEAKLAPAEDQGGGAMQGMGNQLGGLASLAGVQLPRSEIDKATLALEIMQSRAFLGDFVERREIGPELMAITEWNLHSNTVKYDPELYNEERQEWVRDVQSPRTPEPSRWEYVRAFREILRVSTDEMTGFTRVVVEHKSPVIAKQWVDWLIEDINDHIRRRDITESTNSVEYLERELQQINLASMRGIFYQLIEKETRTIMLANVRPEYVFRVIDPAVISEEPAKPSRALVCIAITFLGGLFAVVIVLIRHFVRQAKSRQTVDA